MSLRQVTKRKCKKQSIFLGSFLFSSEYDHCLLTLSFSTEMMEWKWSKSWLIFLLLVKAVCWCCVCTVLYVVSFASIHGWPVITHWNVYHPVTALLHVNQPLQIFICSVSVSQWDYTQPQTLFEIKSITANSGWHVLVLSSKWKWIRAKIVIIYLPDAFVSPQWKKQWFTEILSWTADGREGWQFISDEWGC